MEQTLMYPAVHYTFIEVIQNYFEREFFFFPKDVKNHGKDIFC